MTKNKIIMWYTLSIMAGYCLISIPVDICFGLITVANIVMVGIEDEPENTEEEGE